MIYGLIIAAGKQSRFNSEVPKALVPYKGKPLLETNIERLRKYCNIVYVVCSPENEKWFSKYDKIVIKSGLGCGDAVYNALVSLPPVSITNDDSVFIQWGDCAVDPQVYAECLRVAKTDDSQATLIPCRLEKNPYVAIEQVLSNLINVKFSKYDKMPEQGYHDLSVFYSKSMFTLLSSLTEFRYMFFNNGKYNFPKHNNEFQFLDVFNECLTSAKIIDMTDKNLECFSFNTLEEYNKQVDKM